jgi:hypothetical protein
MTATPPIVDRETWQKQIDASASGRERTPARGRDCRGSLAGSRSSTPSRGRSQQSALGPVGGSACVLRTRVGGGHRYAWISARLQCRVVTLEASRVELSVVCTILRLDRRQRDVPG